MLAISVVLVSYNSARWLAECLDALAAQTYPARELIVVDNASTDDSARLLAQQFPHLRLIVNRVNVGFAAGTNLGIRLAQGAAVATLNPDTRVEPDYLERLAAPLADPRVGASAPLMLSMENPGRVDAAGIRIDPLGFAWNRGAGQAARAFQTPGRVFGACGGAALYRRAMLDEVGLFDEDFFAFYEDADLAWRAHRAGWQTQFVPGARVYHAHGASFGRVSPRKTYLLSRNRWWTVMKNSDPGFFWAFMPARLAADLLALAKAAAQGQFAPAWTGRRDAWAGRAAMLARRQAVRVRPRQSLGG